jgi:Periplasmic binding protein
VQAAQPDLVYISSYPSDTVGILRSIGELSLDTKMLGGGLAGLPAAAIKMQLGEVANGIVNVDLWEPVPTMQFLGVMDFVKKYRARAPAEGVDLFGYFLPPFAYSELRILGDAIAATKTFRRRQACRIPALAPIPHDRGRHRLRARRRMDRSATDLSASRHQGVRRRAVPRTGDSRDPGARAIQNR